MDKCPFEKCEWATGGICVVPCMKLKEKQKAMEELERKGRLEEIARNIEEKKRLIEMIGKLNTEHCDRVRVMLRRYGAKTTGELTLDQVKRYYYWLLDVKAVEEG